MQICTSLQTDNHARTQPLSFYRLDALPAAQPTASKHWRSIQSSIAAEIHQASEWSYGPSGCVIFLSLNLFACSLVYSTGVQIIITVYMQAPDKQMTVHLTVRMETNTTNYTSGWTYCLHITLTTPYNIKIWNTKRAFLLPIFGKDHNHRNLKSVYVAHSNNWPDTCKHKSNM